MNEKTLTNTRPLVATEVPVDDQHNPQYTAQHISDYRAVLHREALLRANNDPSKLEEAKRWASMAAGGTFGKSALLNRIASGLWPMVLPPPRSMSYPWYSIVESDEPEELWLEAPSAVDLLNLGEQSGRWLSEHSDDGGLGKNKARMVSVNQFRWKVLDQVGPDQLHITSSGWEELGFVWLLSIDEVFAKDAQQAIVSWHNPMLKKITTLEQLILEQRWHIRKRVDEMRAAIDHDLGAKLLEKAKEKDGQFSRFNQTAVTQNLQAKRDMVQARIQEGKPGIPDKAEVQTMVDQAVARYLQPRSGSGSGWYSVADDGALVLHTWRIRRIAPKIIPESIYVDPSTLERSDDGI